MLGLECGPGTESQTARTLGCTGGLELELQLGCEENLKRRSDSIVFPMRGLAAYEQARHHRAYAPRWLLVDINVILFFFFFLPAVEGAAEGPEEEPSAAV